MLLVPEDLPSCPPVSAVRGPLFSNREPRGEGPETVCVQHRH